MSRRVGIIAVGTTGEVRRLLGAIEYLAMNGTKVLVFVGANELKIYTQNKLFQKFEFVKISSIDKISGLDCVVGFFSKNWLAALKFGNKYDKKVKLIGLKESFSSYKNFLKEVAIYACVLFYFLQLKEKFCGFLFYNYKVPFFVRFFGKKRLELINMGVQVCHLNGYDIAGISARLSRGICEFTPLKSRSFLNSVEYLDFERDGAVTDPDFWDFFTSSDVVVYNEVYTAKIDRSKINFIIHHGSEYRENPGKYRELDREVDVLLVSGPNLLTIDKKSFWLPSPVDVSQVRTYKKNTTKDDMLIVHSSTHRARKGTDTIERVVSDIAQDGIGVSLRIIEKTAYKENLAKKGEADIYIDLMQPRGIGLGGLEGMALGIPVISMATPEIVSFYKKYFGYCPFINVRNEKELGMVIKKLVQNKKEYDKWSKRSSEFICYHDIRNCAKRFEKIINMAIIGKEITQEDVLSIRDIKNNWEV